MNNSRLIAASLLFIFGIFNLHAQNSKELKLVFAGDIMGHDSQIESAKKMGDGRHDYTSCFKYIEPYISSADIAIGNLEVTLAGPPYKGYPAFSSPDALASELKNVGFDILVNANNHAIDRRKKGLERTLNVLDSIGLIQSGVFKDELERMTEYPLIIEKNGIRLALLNYTYGTNGIKVTAPNIVNYIDTTIISQDLEKAATANPDFTIVLMHWGKEYERKENTVQIKMAHFLFKNGADAIIGSHPHVVQPIKEYGQGRLVVFSMGNMISNQRKRYTDGGILVDLTLRKTDSTRIVDYNYLPIWVHKPVNKKGTAFSLVPAAIDSTTWKQMMFTSEDEQSIGQFLNDTKENLPDINEVQLDWLK
ncbi:CapA family protein [Bacteroidota bacterium]